MSSPSFPSFEQVPPARAYRLDISCASASSPVVLSVTGFIDASNAREVARCVQSQFSQRNDIVIDLSQLHFVGLGGLWIIIGLPQIAFSRGLCCAVVAGRRVDHLLDRVNDGRPPWVFGDLRRACDAVRTGGHHASASKASA